MVFRSVARVAIALLGLTACGGGPSPAPPGATGPAPTPIPPRPGGEYSVTITTGGGQIYIDKLELEFNRRRGIHAFYGFYEDKYETMTQVPFTDLERIEITGPVPAGILERIRDQFRDIDLREDQAFETRLTFLDQTSTRFYAIIPKLRGERDFQLWELVMSGNPVGIERIEFDR